MNELIDTTEMYLRTIFELEEEGAVPMRARIVDRLHQSGPTVSQTVARMQRDGLVKVLDDRQLVLTPEGRRQAVQVMRKHRLAELLLVEVLGLEWEKVHAEACRWEHVISTDVEKRIVELVGDPAYSPYGNPIPGLADLEAGADSPDAPPVVPLDRALGEDRQSIVISRITEGVQADGHSLDELSAAGVRPGAVVEVERTGDQLWLNGAEFPAKLAEHLFIDAP
ncbi:metal-dependent transcriptional regulator [Cumulibacter manganitolerans]|uniref:metal-dependent transcriptional regulator n=1 Tax=Cumulibacter manganitolerans TaxID=1884992 RepID=UPI0012978103|nr:metal-dependent transcriptional regulator [Cumulibacter manganitolerans]